MKDIRVLDCTLRDGGRIIDCAFADDVIIGINKQLYRAGIDIVEVGFLRDRENFNGSSTFFSVLQDTERYISFDGESEIKYVVFVDCGLYDVNKLPKQSETKISGIRYGFTKKDFICNRDKIIDETNKIKQLGYDLYLQAVNTNGYNSSELSLLIDMANDLMPVSFGIVDTYGSMYLDDLEHIWQIVDKELNRNIDIDFHSHDNMEMSFALSQRLINLADGKRKIIIDATLNGMGKCAGNLKTELIVDFLSRKLNCDYRIDAVLDAIDRYVYQYKERHKWGYSIPAFMAGIFRSHPNNVIFLTEKYRLNNKDIKYILSAIDEEKRQRYDYENIAGIYREYCMTKIDDTAVLAQLDKNFSGKDILLMAPGISSEAQKYEISGYIQKEKPLVVSVNFSPKGIDYDYLFFANTIHWEKQADFVDHSRCILTSNIRTATDDTYCVDYPSLIVDNSPLGDNSVIMLLYLLKKLSVSSITIAGFDGLKKHTANYVQNAAPIIPQNMRYDDVNREIKRMFEQFVEKSEGKITIKFLTSSLYA